MALKRMERTPLYKQVSDTIIQEIMSGNLTMGAKINETWISEQLGVSRTPIREALRYLEAEGWVEETEKTGYAVFTPSLEDYEQLSECRAVLEGLAARKMAQFATEEEVVQLKAILDETQKTLQDGDYKGMLDANDRFHQHIADSSQNRHIQKILISLKSKIKLYRYLLFEQSSRSKEFYQEHVQIYEAIKQRDGEQAEREMLQHLKNDRRSMAMHFGLTNKITG